MWWMLRSAVSKGLTVGNLGDQGSNEEPGGHVGKLIADQIKIRFEPHYRSILGRSLLGCCLVHR